MTSAIETLKTWITESDNIVFFGGAGVSTESGIPDFRSTDGLYHQKFDYPPETILSHTFFYQHIDTLPEDLLDQLAHDFGVSWWDNDWDIEQKRATFRESWHVRRHLGTKYAVELALSTSFGSGKVQEWFEYGGEPNHYRIFDVDIRQVNDNIRTFLQILEVVSRKSAVLDSIRAISVRELILYFGAVMSVTKKFKLTTGEVNTDIDIMGDEAGNALCDWDGGLIMMDKEATV